MHFQRTLLAGAVLAALAPFASAQTADATPKVVVTANAFRAGEGDQILTPAKVLAGDELRDKLGSSLGETLSQELGVSASAFGAGASRPIIRGMEGPRVKMMENGMAVSDVSGLSTDHAVSAEGAVSTQIEILRGPAALLYGSGAIGGLVNVVNERIPTAIEEKPAGQLEGRYSSVDRGRIFSGSADGAAGGIALHADASWRDTGDYRIPGARIVGDPAPAGGRLPHSDTRERSAGFGGSLVGDWGHAGASISRMTNLYGVPSDEGARIDQAQTRYDFDSLIKAPLAGFETLRLKASHTDYHHAELDEHDAPAVVFRNRSTETRWELAHRPLRGWHGTFGMQVENARFSALNVAGGPDTVPVTRSASTAGFLVEEADVGPLRLNAGVRIESVSRKPVTGLDRAYTLHSASVGGLWPFAPGYGLGLTLSHAQRAPAIEELYSRGPHDATVTYDIGNPGFAAETSRNVELSVQKSAGLLRWRANAFHNRVHDFIYGQITGRLLDEEGDAGDALRERIFRQGDAVMRGVEAELTWNQTGAGWSGRLFADGSRGRLVNGGHLPLQPADRAGASVGYRQGAWRAGLSLVHARGQDRLAAFETAPTPGYNQLNANLSYRQPLGDGELTWFLLARNLLNDEIRVATSVIRDIAPLPGRSFTAGVRMRF